MSFPSLLRRGAYIVGKRLIGSSFNTNLKKMQSLQYLSAEENSAMQQRTLSQLITLAYRQVPFYGQPFDDIGIIRPNGRVDLQRFSQLPPITRESIRQNNNALVNKDLSTRRRVKKLSTGGTTGNPVYPLADLDYWDWCHAQTWLYYSWMGLKIGSPYLFFWGAPQDIGQQSQDWKSKLWIDTIQQRYALNCRQLSPAIMQDYLERINRMTRHQHLVASISELYDMACFCLDNNLKIRRSFKGISVTTAALTEEMRDVIQSVFHGPVYSRYGCREAGDLACECEYQNGLHINPLYSYIEVVDEDNIPMPPGEEGRILVTNLHNTLMPLIRYELGDTGIMSHKERCACGRNWKSLASITGRIHERLLLPDGSTFGKVFLHYAMEALASIHGYQIHQIAWDTIEVHLVSPIPDYPVQCRAEIEESYQRLMKITGNMLKITYHQVDALEKAPSGKRMVILNKIPAHIPREASLLVLQ